jgi:hypothetical protein
MSTKYLVSLCAVAVLAACGQRESNPSRGGDSAGPADTAPSAAGDAATTPGTPSTPAQNPPAESAPAEPPPTSN